MWRKTIILLIAVPLAVILIAFAVANRQVVTVSFDPFSSSEPAYAATLPLFVVMFGALILGILIGGFAAWLGQGRWRRATRRLNGEVRALHQELENIHRRLASTQGLAVSPDPARHSIIPPQVS